MNEFKQDYQNEIIQYIKQAGVDQVLFIEIDHLFSLANLLRSRFELEMQRGSTTEEYIEMIKISSSFINK